MLFYIDEFPEQLHHTQEPELLFPRVGCLAPQTTSAIAQLDKDHALDESSGRELQYLLQAWEYLRVLLWFAPSPYSSSASSY